MKAFPSAEPIYSKDIVGVKESAGMDLRDYFAAKAMPELLREDLKVSFDKQKGFEWLGEFSYKIADAMIKARKNG
jgi:hypothetical protein